MVISSFSGVDKGTAERLFHLDKLLCTAKAVHKSADVDRERWRK